MTYEDLKAQIGNALEDMVLELEGRNDIEFDIQSYKWKQLVVNFTGWLLELEIPSEEEQRQNDLLNQADALGDEGRGR